MRLAALAAALWTAAAAARADTVYLTNGNTMEGVVVSKNKTELVLDIGYGTVTLAVSDVARIARGTAPGLDGGAGQRRRGYDSGAKVPAGAESLDALYRRAVTQREKALDAKAARRSLEDEKTAIQERLPDSKQHFREAAADLAGHDPNVDPRAYNSAIAEVNAAGAGIQADHLRLEQLDELERATEAEAHRYLDAWRELDAAVRGEPARLVAASGAAQKEYVGWLAGETRAMAKDFRSDTVASETRGDRVIVKVVINGRETGRFLVDTGASATLLYRGIATRLALGSDAVVGKTRSRVADGREIDAEIVRLASIQVGRSRVDGALAVVVPFDPPDIDGLLGMTFLNHFVARVDPANGRLVLEDLK